MVIGWPKVSEGHQPLVSTISTTSAVFGQAFDLGETIYAVGVVPASYFGVIYVYVRESRKMEGNGGEKKCKHNVPLSDTGIEIGEKHKLGEKSQSHVILSASSLWRPKLLYWYTFSPISVNVLNASVRATGRSPMS